MLGKLWGKGSAAGSRRLDAVDSRGLEVVDDDPETVWSLWDNALAEQDSRHSGITPLSGAAAFSIAPMSPSRSPSTTELATAAQTVSDLDEIPTQPTALEEDLSDEQRARQALDVVEQFHPRIATTIRAFWGYNECPLYINKLIMEGDDGMGHARSGFNPQAAQAMLVLADLHDTLFGAREAHSTITPRR